MVVKYRLLVSINNTQNETSYRNPLPSLQNKTHPIPLPWAWREEAIKERERERWEGHHAVRKLTWTKELGPKKKTSFSLITSANTAKVAGDLFLEPQVHIFTYSSISFCIYREIEINFYRNFDRVAEMW